MDGNQEASASATVDTGAAADDAILNPGEPAAGSPAQGEGQAAKPAEGDESLLNPGEPEKKEPEVPEEYKDFNLPEGFTLDGEEKTKVLGMFKELKLTQDGAQKLVDYFMERQVAAKEADLAALADRRREWRAEARQKPTFQEDRALALKGMKAVIKTPEEAALFQDTWLSDHPAVFNLFARIGRLLGDDTPPPKGSGAAPESSVTTRFPVKVNQ